MGQFDSPGEAALARLKSDALSSSYVDGAVDRISGLGGIILEAVGFKGASGLVDLFSNLKSLAATKDETNLIYFGEALVDDIRRLYRLFEGIKQQLDDEINSPAFGKAVANATLHITRTNIEGRLKRLAHLIANGVKESDLEEESLDDMMRAAVELKDADIILLRKIYDSQNPMLGVKNLNSQNWHGNVQGVWREFVDSGNLNSEEHLGYRSSFARLESLGLIQRVENAGMYGVGNDLYALLMEGKKFYERLQEISSE